MHSGYWSAISTYEAKDDIPGLEVGLVFIVLEVDQTWKQENHVTTLIHDGRMAEATSNLAWKLVFDALATGIIPLQVMMPMREVDVLFMEDGSPLEGSSLELSALESFVND